MTTKKWIAVDALPGRDRPDPIEPPSSRIEAGTALLELERLGQWVQVQTPDGNELWVDGRRLHEAEPAAAPDDARAGKEGTPPEPAPQPPPPPAQPAAPVWAATHTVPPEGLQAWAEPDPAGMVIANLAGGVELRVVERRADWAQVDAANGWKGWVDGRRLVAADLATPAPQQPNMSATSHPAFAASKTAGTSTAKSISLRQVAAFAVPVSALLPWFGSWLSDGSSTAADVPAAFLWSPDADLSFPNMGTVMLVVGAAVLVAEFMARYARYRRITASVVVGVATLYLLQTFRLFLDWEGEFTTAVWTTITEGLAIGPLVALAAGIVLLVKRQPEPDGGQPMPGGAAPA